MQPRTPQPDIIYWLEMMQAPTFSELCHIAFVAAGDDINTLWAIYHGRPTPEYVDDSGNGVDDIGVLAEYLSFNERRRWSDL